jgi:hypothetical protein
MSPFFLGFNASSSSVPVFEALFYGERPIAYGSSLINDTFILVGTGNMPSLISHRDGCGEQWIYLLMEATFKLANVIHT